MKRSLALALLSLPTLVFANGGGYAHGLKFTGNPVPFEPQGVDQVEILDEQLSIVLEPEEAWVRVDYRMKNTGKKTKVTFGFPVEVNDKDSLFGSPLTKNQKLASNLTNYQVTASGASVEAKFESEPFGKKAAPEFPGAEILRGIEGWMVSTISFAAEEEKAVTISYQARLWADSSFVSSDAYSGAAKFVYRLSTGGVWKGPIQRGLVHVSTRYINPDKVKIKTPAGKFRRVGDEWTWEFSNLEPSLKDDILIDAVPSGHFYEGTGSAKTKGYTEEEGKYFRHHSEYSVKASSELPPAEGYSYLASHVKGKEGEDDKYRAWAEGVDGHGIGEWLELSLSKPEKLSALEIETGYAGTDEMFKANGRPSEMEVTLNGKHRFMASLRDTRYEQLIHIRGYTQPVSKIRLTIKQVYPGKRFEDTCISRVGLVTPLAKKPKLTLAR